MSDFEMLLAYPAAIAAMPCDSAGLGPVKICTRAGDLVLWDSRTIHCNAPLGAIPNAAAAAPALSDLVAAADTAIGTSSHEDATGGGWVAQPVLGDADGVDNPRLCACAVCRGAVPVRPSAPLGRLGVYVCMQPAALTVAPPRLREALVRLRAWTGHAPFRDVENLGDRVLGCQDAEWLFQTPLPRLVAGCRIRRALAGLEWGAADVEMSEFGHLKV
jgi:hypothetical protein